MPTSNSNSGSRRLISLLLYSPNNNRPWRDPSSFGTRQNTTAEHESPNSSTRLNPRTPGPRGTSNLERITVCTIRCAEKRGFMIIDDLKFKTECYYGKISSRHVLQVLLTDGTSAVVLYRLAKFFQKIGLGI